MTREPLRIAVFIPSLSDGGAQRQCILLLNEWSQRADVSPVFIRTAAGEHDHLLMTENLKIYDLQVRSNYDPSVIIKLVKILRAEHSHVLFSWLQASDVPSYFAQLLSPGTKWVIAERNSKHPEDWRFWLRGKLGRHADAIVANSEQGLRYWDQFRPRGKRFVIGNAVVRPEVSQADSMRSRSVDFLHVGRLEPHKNVSRVIDSFAVVCALRNESTLTIVGDGSQRSNLEAQVAQLGLSGNVTFTGFQPDAGPFYESARCLVTLSQYEGMPNVLAEAIVSGLSVVVSDIPEHLALLGDSYEHSVPLDASPRAIASQMLMALEEPQPPSALSDARTRLSRATPHQVAEEYSEWFRSILRPVR